MQARFFFKINSTQCHIDKAPFFMCQELTRGNNAHVLHQTAPLGTTTAKKEGSFVMLNRLKPNRLLLPPLMLHTQSRPEYRSDFCADKYLDPRK